MLPAIIHVNVLALCYRYESENIFILLLILQITNKHSKLELMISILYHEFTTLFCIRSYQLLIYTK